MKKNYQITTQELISDDVKKIIWNEFYQSRNRGIELRKHSPWMYTQSGEKTYCISATENNNAPDVKTIGCLIIKEHSADKKHTIGMIGYVCTDIGWRGNGIGDALISKAIELAKQQKLSELVLWSQLEKFYTRHGFSHDNDDIFRHYNCPPPINLNGSISKKPWPSSAETRGLPAFSKAANIFSSNKACVIILETDSYPIVAEWEGNDAEVIAIIATVVRGPWSINASVNDTVLKILDNYNCTDFIDQPSRRFNLIMADTNAPSCHIRILDRI